MPYAKERPGGILVAVAWRVTWRVPCLSLCRGTERFVTLPLLVAKALDSSRLYQVPGEPDYCNHVSFDRFRNQAEGSEGAMRPVISN
jgi:hypothetical protein